MKGASHTCADDAGCALGSVAGMLVVATPEVPPELLAAPAAAAAAAAAVASSSARASCCSFATVRGTLLEGALDCADMVEVGVAPEVAPQSLPD